ncbi:MAG: hypothetical protein LQ352_007961 [Teloschistes flavicans]|nr:MAG: hypothetical protein LQ352_007961 [Teloschistes flavicans]
MTWCLKYYLGGESDIDRYEESQEEIRSRALKYVAEGNMQYALYMFEALHRIYTTVSRPLQHSDGCDESIIRPYDPRELADLHLQRDNYFQAELVLEESIILRDMYIRFHDLDEDEVESSVGSLITLYNESKARIHLCDTFCSADEIMLRRAARIDNVELWKGLSFAGLIPPFNDIEREDADFYNAPNLSRLIHDQEDYVQDWPTSDKVPLQTALRGESSTAHLAADAPENEMSLHKAVIRNSSLELLSLLGKGNVDLDSRDENGDTALNLAIRLGRPAMVRILSRRGAK